MTSHSYFYQFGDQKVFASEHAPISFNIKNNYVIVAMDNYTVAVHDVTNNLSLVNWFPVCGCVLKIDYCTLDDYIITMESKDHSNAGSIANNSIRTYHNWRSSGEQNKMKFRAALCTKGTPVGGHGLSSQLHLAGDDKVIAGDVQYRESAIEVLEFLHLSHPLAFAIYTNPSFKRSFTSSKQNQNFEDMSSTVAISENTYVHLYRLCQSHKSNSPSLSTQRPSSRNSKNDLDLVYDLNFCFQHLYTVNFNFIVFEVATFAHILAAASKDKVQIIQILEVKEKCEKFSETLETKKMETIPYINLEINKSWLTSVSNERKMVASKQKMRPKEILGPTHDLDTASITLLRYADSQELSFETLLFRKYNIPTEEQYVQKVHLVRVKDFDEYGFIIVKIHEIVHYSFCARQNEVVKIADYDFKNEYVIGMTFADSVNLMHVAFANGDLVTYSSRLCARDLFQCDNVYKKVTLTRFSKVTLMGLTDVKSSGQWIFACCKYNFSEVHEAVNAVVVSSDSWNFYLFSQPQHEQLKKSIISFADHKGTKKLLQMFLCGLLVFPCKEELNNQYLEDIIICCLKTESFYSEIVPCLLDNKILEISDVLNIFQTLETKELYNKHLFKLYAKKNLIKANFSKLTEDQFRWIVIKVIDISVTLLFDIIVTNDLEKFLKADLLTIEGIEPDNFESVFLKLLYFSSHGDFDLAEPLVSQLDEVEFKNVLKCQFQLLYHDKHHTSFGWLINQSNPQLYAEVVAYCFLNNVKQNNGFTNLEDIKQVGQCAYILVLEELLNICLKEAGIISYSYMPIHNDKQFTRKVSSIVANQIATDDSKQWKITLDTCKHYINQLLLLYHEFSFNVMEFCPHKINNLCRKIPPWLKEHRHNNLLNLFPPFNGCDPFVSPHNSAANPCFSLCCQSYLIRLQCLLSWPESFHLANTNVVEASCESNNHPAWKSLQFLLLQLKPSDLRSPAEIILFLNSVESHKDDCFVDAYLSTFGNQISIGCWEKIVREKPANLPLPKILKYASCNTTLDQFITMVKSLKCSSTISDSDYYDWIEKSGRLHNRVNLFTVCFKQLLDDGV